MISVRLLLLAMLVSLPALSFAQDTTYMNAQWQPCKEKKASYYRVMTRQPDGKYKVEDHYISGQLQMSGTYLSDKIEDKSQCDGYFVNKDAQGNTTDEGSYTAGKQTGTWKFYYKSSNVLKGTKEFRTDSVVYTLGYDSATGKKKYEITNKGGYCPIREISYYSIAGTVAEESIYSGCNIVQKTQYYSNGRVKQQDRYTVGHAEGNAYDVAGKEIPYTAITPVYNITDKQAEPSVDLGDFLSKNMNYPPKARSSNIEGRVLVKFIVNEDGHISDLYIVRRVDDELSKEAVRCLLAMPPWKPATINNIPVKVYFVQPVTFKLD